MANLDPDLFGALRQAATDAADDGVEFFVNSGWRFPTATVFGPQDGVTPTTRDWARWAATIPHTIVTGIGPRVKRTIA